MTDFFRRLLTHVVLALGLWYVAALALERLIPGFVSPFVNLPGVGLILVVLACIALATNASGTSRISRIASLALLGLLLVCACLFLWTRVDDLGGLGLMLICAAIVSAGLFCVAIWPQEDTA